MKAAFVSIAFVVTGKFVVSAFAMLLLLNEEQLSKGVLSLHVLSGASLLASG